MLFRSQEQFTEHIDSLCGEHTSLDAQLAAIRAGDHGRFEEFMHDLRHHIEREDNGLFPAAAIALDGPDWDEVDEQTPAAR